MTTSQLSSFPLPPRNGAKTDTTPLDHLAHCIVPVTRSKWMESSLRAIAPNSMR